MPISVTQREVTVTFAADKVSFGGPGYDAANGRIDIPTDVGLINLELVSAPRGASFPSTPVQWVNSIPVPAGPSTPATVEHRPINGPRGATVRRLDGFRATVLILTAQAVPERLSFYVLVQQDGQFFGTDPTIVTMPSGGGSGG